jgi:hypothetical protein
MWDFTHKNTSMDSLISQGYNKEMIEAVSNLYHIIYNATSTVRRNLKTKLEEITNQIIPFSTKVYGNIIALVKALIIAGLDFDKNTTYENTKEQLQMD